jgi:hypothetical protein
MRSVIVEFVVAGRDCPEGDWQPTVHTQDGPNGVTRVWAVSVWPTAFWDRFSGQRAAREFDALPGTWFAPLGQDIIVRPGERVAAEKEESGGVVTVRLLRLAE